MIKYVTLLNMFYIYIYILKNIKKYKNNNYKRIINITIIFNC